jgi:hypothetical protein
MNSQGQPTRGGTRASGLGVGLTTSRRKKKEYVRNVTHNL